MLDLARRILRRKASATTRIDVQAVRGADAVWTPRRYDELIKEGYEHAVWVYACVSWLTRLARGVVWVVHDGKEEVDDHPLAQLLNRPSDRQAGDAFIESVYGCYLTAGNAYIERVGTERLPPAELHVKRPDRMRVLPDATLGVRGYEYEVEQQRHRFEAWEVRHLKTWHPRNDWYGMSPIEAAARGVDIFNTGQAHNLALMQNGARPTGAWVTGGSLTEQQFRRLREQYDERASLSRRGAPLLVEGGATWQELGLSPRDLDFLRGQTDAARQIHAAYGVHPVVTGLQEGTYENQQQALRSTMLNAVLPFLDTFTAELNAWLAPLYGPRVRLAYDRDAFPAMSEDQDSLWRRAETGWAKGILTRNEARVLVGYDELPEDAGNLFVNEMYGRVPREGVLPADGARTERAWNLTDEAQRGAYVKERTALQVSWEDAMTSAAEAGLRAAHAPAIAAIRDAETTDAMLAAARLADATAFADAVRPVWLAAMLDGGLDVLTRLQGDKAAAARDLIRKDDTINAARRVFGIAFSESIEFAFNHIAQLAGRVTVTSVDAVRDAVQRGVRDGLSIPDIAALVDDVALDAIIPNRSTVIARTETIRATNAGGQAAARGTGLTLVKVWLSAVDDRTRDAHLAANGQRVPLDTPYTVDGESLMYPGDPDGSAENTIACRCSEQYEEA